MMFHGEITSVLNGDIIKIRFPDLPRQGKTDFL